MAAYLYKQICNRYHILVLVSVILMVTLGGCAFFQTKIQPPATEQPLPVPDNSSVTTTGTGGSEMISKQGESTIRLSEGKPQVQGPTPVAVTSGEPLPPEQVQQILSRLPALPEDLQEQVELKLPQELLPPPRSGETKQESFPPPAAPVTPTTVTAAGPLEVLRFAPEGEIPLAPFVNITFNQPMVALTSLDELAAQEVPVRLEPSLPGTWRWVGTKTLTFEYESDQIDRLPKATIYHVTVPAGTRSVVGGILEKAVEWSFRTPPPKVTSHYPSDESQPQDPLLFLAFDQRIDPAAVLKTIQLQADGRAIPVKLVDQSEAKTDKTIQNLVKNTPDGRWMAFRAEQLLPLDSAISITIGPGTPSAEGPLTTQEAQTVSFRTYAPLRIEESGCYWSGNECKPLNPFYIRFNNQLDLDTFQEGMLTIRPELPGASVNVNGSTITIQGVTKGRTTYIVKVSKDIQDVFGQKLGQDAEREFKVGSAESALAGPDKTFITLDPAASQPVFSVYAINYNKVDVKIYAVQPSDWPAFLQYLRNYQRSDVKVKMPGRLALEKSLPVEAPADTMTQVDIDLKPAMDGQAGQFIVVVEPPKILFKKTPYWQTVHAWVQVTQIGLDAFADHSQMVTWVTSLKDGTPLSNVTVEAGPSDQQISTDADGLARFDIPDQTTYLVARSGADQAMLPRSESYWSEDSWSHRPVNDELRWYVFDDRQMYRPGEEIHVKGWLRRIGGKQNGDVGLVGDAVSAVNYTINDPQGNKLTSGRVGVDSLGGFDFSVTLPEKVNLGYAQISFSAEGNLSELNNTQQTHSFQIQEFRRPEFEVKTRNETPGPYFAGGQAVVAVAARYYAGGALPNADVTWQVTSSPASYHPPKWPDFTFGTWTPWWVFDFEIGMPTGDGGKSETFTGKTDAAGEHYLHLDFPQPAEPRPTQVTAAATVMDVNRQAWTNSTDLLVHPASLYVGLRSDSYFVERGKPLKIDLIVTDLDGNPVADRPVEVRASRMEWKYRQGHWAEVEVDTQKCTVGSSTEPVSCTFNTPLGGSYQITAQVSDELGRLNQSQITRWVSGGGRPPSRNVEQEKATLIPDKETYQPGDTAHILVQSPFSPADGLLTVSRSGILYTQHFRIEDGTATLQIPIEEEHLPNLNVQVDLAGSAARRDDAGEPLANVPPRPAYATGQINLKIPPLQRTLSLEVTPAQPEMEPGKETSIDVTLKDAAGKPVSGAQLTVVVVDEAVLALTNYQPADPISVFYADRPSDFDSAYSRSSIVLLDPQALANATRNLQAAQDNARTALFAKEAPAPMMAMPTMAAEAAAPGQASTQPIQVRMDFNPLAIFAPRVQTDANGQARVSLKLPDNLTRYRIIAVAVDEGHRFGLAEANLVARLPLMVRPSAPRFLNFGDRFELPVVLQNQTDQAMTVDVAIQVRNLELTGDSGLRVTVPARDRVEVRFPATTQKAGTARFQVAAVAGEYSDAATVQLPVYTPATTEAFATYGVVDTGAIVQPVTAPGNVFPQYGGLEVNTSSTALQALTDAVLYLVAYPFECSEQLSSRILAVAALRDVLTAFQTKDLPSPAEMEAAVQRDITTLQGMQNSDGGFPYWRRGQESIPFNTIHVAHALQRAKDKGFSVPPEMQQSLRDHLRQIENYYPSWYSQRTRQTLSAYALYVRNLMGDRDPDKALRLLSESNLEEFNLEAIGWLWQTLEDAPNAKSQLEAIRRHVNNRAVETAGAANFTTEYDDQSYLLLSSNRRADAILLDSLMIDNPQHDLIPKLVNGLLAHRVKGRWGNTQENVFVLLALDRYFNTYEAQTPDFVARIWLGDTYAGSHEYRGRTTERQETLVPMNYLVDSTAGGSKTQNLILSKEGAGRLYYRLGLRYAPTNLNLKPIDMGFVVQRSYEAVDNPEDVTLGADGVWRIKAGARVRVRVTMVADNRRYHVALVDPLPAGLEIVNPALAVSDIPPSDPNSQEYRYGWWWGPWFNHQNLRDERAEAFTPLLWDGVYQYTYIARATTPGTYVVPPAKAEEMYSPEVFGRSGSNTVMIK